jgi:uncharacterized membrane protein YfcA
MAFVCSFAGAAAVAWLPKEFVRPLVLVLLALVLAYTVVRPEFGVAAGARLSKDKERRLAVIAGAVLGFYDGFFGPGAGSFMIFAFVRWFRLDFLHASSAAKVVNLATNAAALAYFVPSGHVLWGIGLAMATFNIAGALLGARLALRHGSSFVRGTFIVVASLLICRLGYDTFF